MESIKQTSLPRGAASRNARGQYVTVQERVYRELRTALAQGQLEPGRPVTLRGLAEMLHVSPMPVRDAVRRLVAERALIKLNNRRVAVPVMTAETFEQICRARLALEPEAAMRALPGIGDEQLSILVRLDERCSKAMERGDVGAYMQTNQKFHFTLYKSVSQEVYMPIIESLWLQFGPFMRTVVGRWGTTRMVDQHQRALEAIKRGNRRALGKAIEADIMDGMQIIGEQALNDHCEQQRKTS